jgi:hypothetical protein
MLRTVFLKGRTVSAILPSSLMLVCLNNRRTNNNGEHPINPITLRSRQPLPTLV